MLRYLWTVEAIDKFIFWISYSTISTSHYIVTYQTLSQPWRSSKDLTFFSTSPNVGSTPFLNDQDPYQIVLGYLHGSSSGSTYPWLTYVQLLFQRPALYNFRRHDMYFDAI